MEVLRNFVEVDNHRALEAGHLREGSRSFQIRRPECEEGSPEVLIREDPEELTLRAEVGTLKSCINVDHIAQEKWGPHLVDADWHAFCQALKKSIEGEDWGELYDSYKEMSGAVRARKAKALWKMKVATDAGEEYCDSEREDHILVRNKTRLAPGDEHLTDPIVALDRALVCVENSCWKVLLQKPCGGSVLQWPLLASSKVCEKSRPTWIRWTVCVYAQHPWSGMCQGSTGRMASSFSS